MTSPVLMDFLRVSHFGVFENLMPAPSTVCGVCYGGREGKRGEETRSCVEVASEVTVGRYCVLL